MSTVAEILRRRVARGEISSGRAINILWGMGVPLPSAVRLILDEGISA